jgi:hypothetical protein
MGLQLRLFVEIVLLCFWEVDGLYRRVLGEVDEIETPPKC